MARFAPADRQPGLPNVVRQHFPPAQARSEIAAELFVAVCTAEAFLPAGAVSPDQCLAAVSSSASRAPRIITAAEVSRSSWCRPGRRRCTGDFVEATFQREPRTRRGEVVVTGFPRLHVVQSTRPHPARRPGSNTTSSSTLIAEHVFGSWLDHGRNLRGEHRQLLHVTYAATRGCCHRVNVLAGSVVERPWHPGQIAWRRGRYGRH